MIVQTVLKALGFSMVKSPEEHERTRQAAQRVYFLHREVEQLREEALRRRREVLVSRSRENGAQISP